MSDRPDIRSDLEAGAADELISVAERLERERPLPTAAFGSELRGRLLLGRAARPRPARLRLLIAGYICAGSVLLLMGVASIARVGPLGP